MEQTKVIEHFQKQTENYFELMTRLVPQYSEQQKIMCDLIPFELSTNLRVLDLGCGPGILSEVILDRYPHSHVLAFDCTEQMLEVCRNKLSRFGHRLTTQLGDYRRDSFGTGYDLIVAGLTLHHLASPERKTIFKKIFGALNSRGVFIAREIVADSSPFVMEWHYSLWRRFMRSQGEDDSFWHQKHKEKDHPETIEDQLLWLKESGFRHTACHWRYWNFAIISGTKAP